jgi:hypothetical protein
VRVPPPTPKWIALVYGVIAVGLLPWTAYLADSLPRRNLAEHWDLAWAGFDALLALLVARVAWLALHRRRDVALPAAALATMLVVDAWFDVVTSWGTASQWQAVALAVACELPLALLSYAVVRRSERWTRRQAHELAALPPELGRRAAEQFDG